MEVPRIRLALNLIFRGSSYYVVVLHRDTYSKIALFCFEYEGDVCHTSSHHHRATHYEITETDKHDISLGDRQEETEKYDKVYDLFDFHALCREQRKYTLNWSFFPPITMTTFYNPDAQRIEIPHRL